MRKGPKFKLNKEHEANCDATCDWKDNPEMVLETVDSLLKKHGLEIVTHETFGDYYAFSILPLKGKK